MKSPVRGKDISVVEVEHISPRGVWLFVRGQEYFLPYDQFPWFKSATVSAIHNVELFHGHHLHWPALDVDLDLDALTHLERYPLIAQ